MKTQFMQILRNILPSQENGEGPLPLRYWVGNLFFLTIQYLRELTRFTGEIAFIIWAYYMRFVAHYPPLFPVMQAESLYKVTVSIAYVAFIILNYGICMQDYSGFAKKKHEFREGEYLGTSSLFPLWLILILDIVALYMWVPTVLIFLGTVISLTVFGAKGYSEQGRYGITPFARVPMLFLAFWIVSFGHTDEALVISTAVSQTTFGGWVMLLVMLLVLGAVWFTSAAARRKEIARMTKKRGKSGTSKK